MYDVIIAGQGIAGSLLAWECIKHQFKVLLLDPGHSFNASLAAGAIINPVTGKNLQKSWMIDELIPAAIKTYREIEERLQQCFVTDLKIYHIFKNTKEINDWSVKRYEEAYQRYLINRNVFFIKNDEVINPLGAFEIKGGLKVNAYMLLTALRGWFKNQNILIEEHLNEDQICEKSDYVQYKDYKARFLIMATGFKSSASKFFKKIKFAPVKGEALKIIPKNYSIRDHIWGSANIFPLDEVGTIYYAGSTYEWNFKDEFPTQEKREELINKIRKTIFSSFEIVGHVSGVRPAMADRRPVMGLIPESRIGLFNGLGTKGFSLAPYFSKVFCGYLAESNSLPDSVNLKRFQ